MRALCVFRLCTGILDYHIMIQCYYKATKLMYPIDTFLSALDFAWFCTSVRTAFSSCGSGNNQGTSRGCNSCTLERSRERCRIRTRIALHEVVVVRYFSDNYARSSVIAPSSGW